MTSTATMPRTAATNFELIRILSAVAAAIVVVDALSVGAPGLALAAAPFVVGAIRYRRGTTWGTALFLVWAALFVLIGANFIVATGFDAGWGDLLFAYGGTPLALAIAILLISHLAKRRRAA